MTTANPTIVLGHQKPVIRNRWNPGSWTVALFLAWLALLAVPLVGLYNLDSFAPIPADVQLKPWMPALPPLI
jgi:hypothetical protein